MADIFNRERLIIGLQCQGCFQDPDHHFQVVQSSFHANYSVDLLSYFVDKPFVLCDRGYHMKSPSARCI